MLHLRRQLLRCRRHFLCGSRVLLGDRGHVFHGSRHLPDRARHLLGGGQISLAHCRDHPERVRHLCGQAAHLGGSRPDICRGLAILVGCGQDAIQRLARSTGPLDTVRDIAGTFLGRSHCFLRAALDCPHQLRDFA